MQIRVISPEGLEHRQVDELEKLLAGPDLVWVDLPSWDDEAAEVLGRLLHLHPRAVQDCAQRNPMPKVQVYPDHVFVVLHAPEQGKRGHVHYVELDQFIGSGYLVTVHGPLNPHVRPEVAMVETDIVTRRVEAGRLRPTSAARLSYAIVTGLINRMRDYLTTLTQEVWRLEQTVTGGHLGDPEQLLEELFQVRHGLLAIRTMATTSREVYGRMRTLAVFGTGPDAGLLVDIEDQFQRIGALADSQREYLQGVIEFYQTVLVINAALVGQAQNAEVKRLTEASYSQNEEIKRISAWAAIFFAPTLVGTVYGMNFVHMPETHWAAGYPLALALMAVSSVVLYLMFRRRGWL
jgi:magnesium transporter